MTETNNTEDWEGSWGEEFGGKLEEVPVSVALNARCGKCAVTLT
jgi:hypothetical protein